MSAPDSSIRAALSAELDATLRSPVSDTAVLNIFASLPTFSELLPEIYFAVRHDANTLRDLASDSYEHENGFVKLTILKGANFRIRLHWWRAETNMENVANVHNHRFDCISHVLKGQLRDVAWHTDDAGGVFSHYRYSPRSGTESYLLRYLGSRSLNITARATHRRGATYWLSNRSLHTSDVLQPDTITFFIENRSVLASHADVFSRRYPLRDIRLSSPSTSVGTFLATFSQILAKLSYRWD